MFFGPNIGMPNTPPRQDFSDNNAPRGLQALAQNMYQNFGQPPTLGLGQPQQMPQGPQQTPVQRGMLGMSGMPSSPQDFMQRLGMMGGPQGVAGASQNLPMPPNPGQGFMQSLGMYGNQGMQPQGTMGAQQQILEKQRLAQQHQDFMQSLGMYGNQGMPPQGTMPQGPGNPGILGMPQGPYGQGTMGGPQGLGGVGQPGGLQAPSAAGRFPMQLGPHNTTTTQNVLGGGAGQNNMGAFANTYNQPKLI